MTMTDSIKWNPFARVLKYEPDTVREIAAYLDTHGLRSHDREGMEPTADELRMLERTAGLRPDEIAEAKGNLLTTAGLTRICSLIIGGGGNAFNNTNAFTGVGDHNGTTTNDAAVGDTALSASTNKWYQGADASNPTASGAVITNNCTITGSNANFAWNEWCWGIVDSGTITAGSSLPGTTRTLINHKIQGLGTKASGAIWTLQATVTLS